MIFAKPKSAEKKANLPSVQEWVGLDRVEGPVVVMRGGGTAWVMQVGAVNFALLSEPEQDAILKGYRGFLLSLRFPVQVFSLTRRLSLETHLDRLGGMLERERDEAVRELILAQGDFEEGFQQRTTLLTRDSYVIVSGAASRRILESQAATVKGGFAGMGLEVEDVTGEALLNLFLRCFGLPPLGKEVEAATGNLDSFDNN